MNFIYVFLGTVMSYIYKFVNNFGFAIILFTVLVRACLLPLVVKQQKSMAHMQKMQPKLQELQKKYQYDKDKLNEETMKLYQQYKINPMSSCLPLFIQMPILIAIYGVIQNPITYILGHPVTEELKAALTVLCQNPTDTQLNVVAFVSNNFDKAKELLATIQTNFTAEQFVMNFDFFGLNLGLTPSTSVATNPILWVLPILAGLTTFLTSYITQKINGKTQTEEQKSQMKSMQLIFPFMTAYFCYILPAAMGLYWIVGNLIQIVQSFTLDRYIMNKEVEEIEEKEELKAIQRKETKKKKKR
ncbi:MAG: YidC/Oxa1 family membrane protein insertase [Clostridia bacterium]|nr:YidC/Oxa1 family membrane protein insertase [Clostridia bacterium]